MTDNGKKPSVQELLAAAIARRKALGLQAASDPDAPGKLAQAQADARDSLEQALDLISRNLHPFDSRKALLPDGGEQKELKDLYAAVEAECGNASDDIKLWDTYKQRAEAYLSTRHHDTRTITNATVPPGPRPTKPTAENHFTMDDGSISHSGSMIGHQTRSAIRRKFFTDEDIGVASDLNRAWERLCKMYILSGRDMDRIMAEASKSHMISRHFQHNIALLYTHRDTTQALGSYFQYVKNNPEMFFATLKENVTLPDTKAAQDQFTQLTDAVLAALQPLDALPPRGHPRSK